MPLRLVTHSAISALQCYFRKQTVVYKKGRRNIYRCQSKLLTPHQRQLFEWLSSFYIHNLPFDLAMLNGFHRFHWSLIWGQSEFILSRRGQNALDGVRCIVSHYAGMIWVVLTRTLLFLWIDLTEEFLFLLGNDSLTAQFVIRGLWWMAWRRELK